MLLNYLMNSMYEGKVNSFQTRKKEVNFQNLLQGFYKFQHCLNNNRKPYITMYIWNQHIIVYQKKTKGGGYFIS